jgi:lysophospholipase L1-like esterase
MGLTAANACHTVCAMKSQRLAVVIGCAVLLGTLTARAQQGSPVDHWVGTWATAVTWRAPTQAVSAAAPPLTPAPPAPQPAGRGVPPPPVQFNSQTLRQIVHTSIGGSRLRVVFSNAFGTGPVTIGAASVGLRERDASLAAGSLRPLLFAGRPSTIIPAGAVFVSDPVDLSVPPTTDLALDVFLPGDTATWASPLTVHNGAYQTNYVSGAGNHVGEPLAEATTTNSWFLVARVEVMAPPGAAAIVTIGDSITDGTRSTPNTNSRWPDELARRLQAQAATRTLGVLNAGIAGNRVLGEQASSAGINILARFDRDALMQTGARFIVVMEGINDIGQARQNASPGAADLIAAHEQLIERAHVKGLKIFGATLTPFEGAAYFTAEGEAKRVALNEWIRTSKAYDGVIDFDAAVRDPEHPARFLAAYNSGDNLHPSDAGYKAMAAAVDLGLFK